MIDSYVQILVSRWGKYHFWLFIKNDTSLSTKQHVVFIKTTRHFHQNNTSFSSKQHVVFIKTTRHFHQNNTSLSSKQHVVFIKTTRHYQQNNTSLSSKQHVGIESTEYDSKDLFWDFQQKHLEITQKHTNFAPQSPQGEVWKPE